jgi:cyclic-di-AMP phosphodiesterase PgpH
VRFLRLPFVRRHGESTPRRLAGERLARVLLFGLSLLLGLAAILTFQFLPSRYDLRDGDISPYTVKSPYQLTFVSQVRTREARAAAAAAVPDVYALNTQIADIQRQRAVEVLRSISQIRSSGMELDVKRDSIRTISDLVLPPATIDDLLAMDETEWQSVSAETLRVLDRITSNRISERQIEDVKSSVSALVDPVFGSRPAAAVTQLTRSFIRPNFLVDAEATAAAKRAAADQVEPVRVTIERSETILRDGEKVTELALEKLGAAGLVNPTFRWKDALAIFLVLALLVSLLTYYIYSYHPIVADDGRRLLVLAFLIVLTVLAAKLTITGRDVASFWIYLFPIATAPMLIAVLLNVELAFAATALLGAVVGLMATTSFDVTVFTLIGGTVGLLTVSRLERFMTFFRAGAYISAANFLVVLSFQLFGSELDSESVVLLAFISLVNGLLAAGLAMSAVYFLGHALEITTAVSMLELAHPSQPLFRRLLTEAPGTYHHSVVVANLAERAAEAVGADALLCRIGAYYHDIGKIVRPYAFIENQMEGPNVHDDLEPMTSARVVLSHVSDGQALARRYGVPRRVQDLIVQHHGTMLVGYFYRKAREQSGSEHVDEGMFRYPGPKPQSREAGIMMLADSVEAATRSNRNYSLESIQKTIDKIVHERVEDGQFDECDLTLRDLEKIRTTFAVVLQGIFHPRIEYPPDVTPAPRGASARLAERPPTSIGGATPEER